MKQILNKKYLILFILIVSMAVYFLFRNSSKNSLEDFGKVEKVNILQRVTLSGIVRPAHKAVIVAPYAGYVKKIFVKVGEDVNVDAPLVTVVQSLTANEQVFPLRAPIKGRVVQIQKSEGEFVKYSDTSDFILRIDDLSEMYVYVNAAEIDRVKLVLNQEALVKPMALVEKSYKAIVSDLSLAASDKDRWDRSSVVEFPVVLKITNPDQDLKSGMTTLVEIITNKKENVLALRHEYIFTGDSENYVILKDGTKKKIKVGIANDEMQEIVEGLNEGDLVQKVDFSKVLEK